jgi:hypothetical protein
MPERYDWVGWLGKLDAQILFIWLMRGLEDEIPLETLRRMVEGWRANAHRALTADDYRACVDNFLEVSVDARMYLLRQGQIAAEEESDEDDHPGL